MFHRIKQVAIVLLLAFIAATALLATPGCSCSYAYELDLTVRQTSDGRAVEAVGVTLEAEHVRNWPEMLLTDKAGRLSFTFSVSDIAFWPEGTLPRWRLVLSKDGYHDELVDISPRQAPQSRKEVRQMIVTAYMRPKT
jgi:hypothetical protein